MKKWLTAVVVIWSGVASAMAPPFYQQADRDIFNRFVQYVATAEQEQGDNITLIAAFFMDTPYVGGSLEGDSLERLRINLQELDCFTFVENVLALHLMLQSDEHSFDRFCNILQYIRYRNGVMNGYLSRLHYTGEWLYDNQQKGVLLLPQFPASQIFHPELSFMSTHCDLYPALKAHPEWCVGIRQIENSINEQTLYYIPKEQLTAEINIKNGDIIAITTYIKGLDVSHMGFALRNGERIYLLHASSEAKKVIISVDPLQVYLAKRKNHSGIIIARNLN
jgi:hypothetical protein